MSDTTEPTEEQRNAEHNAKMAELKRKQDAEVASKTEGKRRHIHKRLPDGVVPTWAGHF